MKGRTRRWLRRWLEGAGPVAIIGAVLGVAFFIIWVAATEPSLRARLGGALFLVLLIALLIYIYSLVSQPALKVFSPVSFPGSDPTTRERALAAILAVESARPSFVYVTPPPDELSALLSDLKRTGFAEIFGSPGEGKSTLAYHACYRLHLEGFQVHQLRTDVVASMTWTELEGAVLSQLDRLNRRRKVIIMDDAHQLPYGEDLSGLLRHEAQEGHGKYVWVETQLLDEVAALERAPSRVRVDFGALLPHLSDLLSNSAVLGDDLRGRVRGLEDAILAAERGQIQDAWHFNFVATRGGEHLERSLDQLSPVELVVLFLISAATVISGQVELALTALVANLQELPLAWLADSLRQGSSSFTDTIHSLGQSTSQRGPMLRFRRESATDPGRVQSLHYNSARAVIRASLSRQALVSDLLASVRTLLSNDHRKCLYVGVLHRDLGSQAAQFDAVNQEWLTGFLNDPLPDTMGVYGPLLRGIRRVAPDIARTILEELDARRVGERISSVSTGQLGGAAHFLHELESRRADVLGALDARRVAERISSVPAIELDRAAHFLDELDSRRTDIIRALDLTRLAAAASGSQVTEFAQIVHMAQSLGDRGREFIALLDLSTLGLEAQTISIEQVHSLRRLIELTNGRREQFVDALLANSGAARLGQVLSSAGPDSLQEIANLLVALGQEQVTLLEALDYETIGRAASRSQRDQIRGLTLLVARLAEPYRTCLIKRVDWLRVLQNASVEAGLLRATGGCLEGLRKASELSGVVVTTVAAAGVLHTRKEALRDAIRSAYQEAGANPDRWKSRYQGVGKFLWHCSQLHGDLALELQAETIDDLADNLRLAPSMLGPAQQLLSVLDALDPDGARRLLATERIREMLTRFIATRGWEPEEAAMAEWLPLLERHTPELAKDLRAGLGLT